MIVESTMMIAPMDENKRLFATSAYEGLVERECLVAVVADFADGNTMHTIMAEKKNTSVEIRHPATAVIEIAVMIPSDLKMGEGMFAVLTFHLSLKADWFPGQTLQTFMR